MPFAVARALLDDARALAQQAGTLRNAVNVGQHDVRVEHDRLRSRLIAEQLAAMPAESLRSESGKGIRNIAKLSQYGFGSVLAILESSAAALQQIPGIGASTVEAIRSAAQSAAATVEHDTVVRFDADEAPASHVELLRRLHALATVIRVHAATVERAANLTAALDDLLPAASSAGRVMHRFFALPASRRRAQQALSELHGILKSVDAVVVGAALRDIDKAVDKAATTSSTTLWADYVRAAALYQSLLAEARGVPVTESHATAGFVPRRIEEDARRVDLDTSLLRVRLRNYQVFGAQYAIDRRRVILGDEMGLGKTIEAIAVMAHLAARGRQHLLVVCPASVLYNWMQEIDEHSALTAYKAHGDNRQGALTAWTETGGVAITTLPTLRLLTFPAGLRLDLLIVDEAHLIKNRSAQRSQAVAALARTASRVLLMTGTPMENRVEEFRSLVEYVDAGLAARLVAGNQVLSARTFRTKVAEVYLRRNQEDVLKELPERLDVDDWVDLGPAEREQYIEAVRHRQFAGMRRAAYLIGTDTLTAKLERLKEIVDESAANGWKVIVFSYFRDVLDRVGHTLITSPRFELTGSTPTSRRQQVVDGFRRQPGHAVLIGQIEAAGVGLNLQAASVVVITEPQLKPSTEDQAIMRSYRMGQPRMVRVHRLLAKDSVDERILHMLEMKRGLFRAYAHESEAKHADAAAVDTSYSSVDISAVDEAEIIREEQSRLLP
ncbi:DEAD/DEAH box helicase [Dactylosporangium sp. NPDC048998]|uniref:DEAD/DEAH box helicase n=1 Tax=Dactylosporangium sp. NPDC048998 TaxID=3363976 RepID=UPI00371AF98D